MADQVTDLQERMRTSLDPVSAFFLVDSPTALERMVSTLAILTRFGLTSEQIAQVREAVIALRNRDAPGEEAPWRFWVEFRAVAQTRPGCVEVQRVLSKGVEVQVILPGLVAATAPGFLENGFSCGFMPPSFYD